MSPIIYLALQYSPEVRRNSPLIMNYRDAPKRNGAAAAVARHRRGNDAARRGSAPGAAAGVGLGPKCHAHGTALPPRRVTQ